MVVRKRDGTSVRKPIMNTFTVWSDPDEWFDSQYGRVTYREWCKKEIERLAAVGKTVVIREEDDGEIALEEVGTDATEDNLQQSGEGGL